MSHQRNREVRLLKQHPIGAAFPPLSVAAFVELSLDLKKNGLHNPITLFEGRVLDGWNRYRCCTSHKVKMKFAEYTGDDPIGFAVSQNLIRRHLDRTAKLTLARRLLVEEKKQAAKRQRLSKGRGKKVPPIGGTLKGTAASKVGKAVGVSARSIERASAIDKRAIKEVREAVDDGTISLGEGERIAKLPKKEQQRLVKLPKQKRRAATTSNANLLNGLKRMWGHAPEDVRDAFATWMIENEFAEHRGRLSAIDRENVLRLEQHAHG